MFKLSNGNVKLIRANDANFYVNDSYSFTYIFGFKITMIMRTFKHSTKKKKEILKPNPQIQDYRLISLQTLYVWEHKKEIFLVQFDRDLFSAVGFFFLRWWLLGFLEERTMHLFWTFGIFITFVKALFCHSIGIRGKSQMQIKKKSTKRSSSAFPTASFQEARQVNLIALTLLQ